MNVLVTGLTKMGRNKEWGGNHEINKRLSLRGYQGRICRGQCHDGGAEAKEPEDEASEAYDKWIEECEQLAIESESLMTLIDYKMTQGL
mgnify:CR=1 FL=1